MGTESGSKKTSGPEVHAIPYPEKYIDPPKGAESLEKSVFPQIVKIFWTKHTKLSTRFEQINNHSQK